jgi:hypothetical protein
MTTDRLKSFAIIFVAFVILMFGLNVLTMQRQTNAQLSFLPYGGTSTGTSNAQVITVPNLSVHIPGIPISFVVGGGLTNVASTTGVTIAVSGQSPVNLFRITPTGIFPMRGGELQAGMLAQITWDGNQYQLINNIIQDPIGSSKMWHFNSASTPKGWLLADGSCYAQNLYPELFALWVNTYTPGAPSACSGSQFAVPYMNGTLPLTADNQGANTANRVTSAGSGCNAQVGSIAVCGSQSTSGVAAHTHTTAGAATNVGTTLVGSVQLAGGGSSSVPTVGLNLATISTGSAGSATVPMIPPAFVVLRMVKY